MKRETSDFDSILQELGPFGKYQRNNFILLSAIIGFTAMPLAFVFTTRNTNYRCYIEECDGPDINKAIYNVPWINNAIPFDQNKPAICQRFGYSVIGRETEHHIIGTVCNSSHFNKEYIEKCDKVVFENGEATIERDFNLTCMENIWKLSFVGSLGDFSEIIGLPLCGYLSDKYGRLHVMIIGSVLSAIIGTGKSFLYTYEMYLIFEFLETLIGSGMFSGAYIIGIELVTPKYRVLCSTLIICMFSLGEAYLCFIAWITESWRLMLRIIYIPGILFLSYYYFLNESIRWLLMKGKTEEAKQILMKVATCNGVTLNDCVLEKINVTGNDDKDDEDESLWKVFLSPTLTMRFIFCSFVWLTCTFVYYGFNMKSVSISGNLYINYLISVLIEIPANLICYWLLNNRRRKPVLCFSLFVTGILSFLLLVLPMDDMEIIVFSMGKCCITISLSTIYIYAAEVFPTSVRHSLLACCSIFGRMGGIAATQIPFMVLISPSLVYLLFMTMTIIASLLVLSFPETVNIKLPDTVSQSVALSHNTME